MTDSHDLMSKIVSLCKRRGFIFQSSEIYGGLKSSYDYGPLGVELKRNIAQEWWRSMVYEREDVVGLDASILMHPDVWKTSGHLANFSDPLVDCLNCQERFRADKAPKREPGSDTEYHTGGKARGQLKRAVVGSCGYVCPHCQSPELSEEREFRCMFRTTMGPVDPLGEFTEEVWGKDLSKDDFRKKLAQYAEKSAAYLRPETAQAMFVQFLNVQQTMSAKVPFGIAQQGKSFRNEIVVEHFIFRSCEFEQMEMEFFCEPGTQKEWLDYWKHERLKWHQRYSRNPEKYRLRKHDADELAHYSDECYDIEYEYPWGWDELEGVASRTDYDLKKHAEATGVKLSYFDPNKTDPQSGKKGWRFIPYVIEPAAGLTRTLLCYLLDAYTEEKSTDAHGNEKVRMVLKLHPRLAPYKAAILPLVRKDGQPEKAMEIVRQFRAAGIPVSYDEQQSIGKRYARHDEIGTPYCLTVDSESLTDQHVTIRDRDTTEQQRIPVAQALDIVRKRLSLAGGQEGTEG
ncbi:MAG: glycine--tRNA ligase [Deltaproteobacteria bacterium]|nr:glycine--tRNA ligase [Deltaproteobacteria bacterium]